MWFRASGRGLIAAKGGSQQRKYLCDEQNQGCKARVQWVKQATGEWKVSRLDGEHENCGGATTSATIRGAHDVLESIVRADSSISGPKLKKAVEDKIGKKLSLRSIQRAKQQLAEISVAEEAELMTKLRPFLEELAKHSPGTVTNVEARIWSAMFSED